MGSHKLLWHEITAMVERQLRDLEPSAVDELSGLIHKPRSWKTTVGGKTIYFTIWAEQETDGRLGVMVEGRQKGVLGISRVTSNGFYKTSDGAVVPFEERDLWSHGY